MSSDSEDDKPQKKPRKPSLGRKLMRWNPDKDQLVLLTVDNVCVKMGIPIPWDAVAKEIDPDLSGEAIKQHLAKVFKYRELNGREVPQKLDKGARRKAGKLSTDPTTPAKGGKGKKSKDGNDGGDDDVPKKGASLLWHEPQKKTKTPKTANTPDPNTPATVRTTGSRKKATKNTEEDDAVGNAPKSTGKRGRSSVKKSTQRDEDGDETPSKKARTSRLRPKEIPNYNEQYNSDEDVFDAQQDEDEDDIYQDGEVAQPNSMIKNEFDSSQGSALGEIQPPPPFMNPINVAFHQGYQGSNYMDYVHGHPNNRYVNSPDHQASIYNRMMPEGHVGELLRYANSFNHGGLPLVGLSNFRNMNGLPQMGSSNYMSGEEYAPLVHTNFNSELNNPFRENDLRNAIDKKLPSVPEEGEMDTPIAKHKQKTKVPRKKETPNKKKGGSGMSPHQSASGGGHAGVTSKTESEQSNLTVRGDVFSDGNNSGKILMGHETSHGNYHANNLNFGANPYGMIGDMDMQVHTPLGTAPALPSMNPLGMFDSTGYNFNTVPADMHMAMNMQAPTTPIADSPSHYGGGNLNFANAHTGVTPAMNNFEFDNTQLSQYPSHSSSFSSIQASQSNEAVPTNEQGGTVDYGTYAWDPNQYELQMPVDEYANLDGGYGDAGGDFMN